MNVSDGNGWKSLFTSVSKNLAAALDKAKPKAELSTPEAPRPPATGFSGESQFVTTRQVHGASAASVASPEEQRRLADENYKNIPEAFAKHPAATRDYAINLLAVHAQEPEYQARFIQRLKEDGILPQLTGSKVEKADATLAKALDAARSRGTLTDNELRQYGERPAEDRFFFWNEQGWRNIGLAMSPPVRGIAPHPGAVGALKEVEAARTTLVGAQGKVAELEQRLAEELNQFGAGLTSEQREAYVRQFRSSHQAEFDAERTAANTLNTKLGAAPLKDLLVEDPDAAAPLLEAAKALATTEHAMTAIQWGSRVFGETDPALRARIEKGFGKSLSQLGTAMSRDIFEPGVQRAAGKILAESQGDLAKAEKGLYALGEQLKGIKELRVSNADFLTAVKEPLNAVKAGDLEGLKRLVNTWEQSSGLAKSFVGAFYAFGAMVAVQKGKEGEYASMVKELAGSTKGFAELSANAMTTLTTSGKYAKYSGGAKAFGTLVEKLAPGLGMLAAGASLWAHGSQFQKDPSNPFLVTAMIGDAWSMFGEALSVFPPGYVPGKIISAMGAIVSGASDLATTALTLGKTREEQRGLLRKAGVPERVIEGLVSGEVNALAERGKLNPHQVQAFLGGHALLSQDRARMDALLTASEQFRMYNTNFLPFLDRLAAERGTTVESIAQTLQSLISQDGGDQNVRAYLRNNYPETTAWADARAPRDR